MASQASGVDRQRPIRFAILGLLGGLLIFAVVMIVRGRANDTLVLEVGTAQDPSQVRVYVGGGVASPGLYTLASGSRVSDAIAAAGGLSAGADASGLGMAALLEDSDQIIVALAATTTDAPAAAGSGPVTETTPAALLSGGSGPLNVNAASASELETLPGIGPVLAQRIVEYRTAHGPFQQIEELESIQGISLAMVEKLRPLITLGP